MGLKMKLRIWHNSNFGHKTFHYDVLTIQDAFVVLDILAKYDLYLGNLIIGNAQGLEYYDEEKEEWLEWEDEEGYFVDSYNSKGERND